MAIVIRGKSKCPLCGKLIEEGQEIESFSPFVANELDPLYMFTDGAFHSTCFYNHPLAEKAQARWAEIVERNGRGKRLCVVCKREIKHPDDYFTIGHLVEDRNHSLYRYNYCEAHRSCLPRWSELPYVYKLIEDLRESGTWEGPTLDRLLSELKGSRIFT
jgi:hypothetical protein